jgi:hypothetical protein
MAIQALPDLGRVIYEPSPTFSRLRDKTNGWVPLLVLILLSCIVSYWWIATEDFAWLRDHMVAGRPDLKPEAREAMAKFMTPNGMLLSSLGGTILGLPVIYACIAAYYLLASRMMDSQIGYGKWFGFVAWVSVPRLLTIPLTALQIATSHGQLAPEDMNMVSLNYLVFHLPMSAPWGTFMNSLDLTSIWTFALAAIGLKAWTGRSTGTCVFVAALPYVVIYGLWAVKIAVLG